MIDSVDAELSARVLKPGSGSSAARILLRYDPMDPYAVVMTVRVHGQDGVTWLFGRELLDEGLRRATGVGDVSIAPCPQAPTALFHVILRDDASHAVLELRVAPVAEFMRMTFKLVPSGREEKFLAIDDDVSAISG
ncbi:MAG: hypothetical protein QOH68_3590 [Nocardioidaceae bacterium]|nr:hypothetical protein [Nocardioidaceae bacterium]